MAVPATDEQNTDGQNDSPIDLTVIDSNNSQSNDGADAVDNPKENENLPRLKRTACVLCRRRKLKCDGAKPCGTCGRLGHECKYDEVRKKSGPKRGYVKALEARLAQVETMLQSGEGNDAAGGDKSKQPSANRKTSSFAPPSGNIQSIIDKNANKNKQFEQAAASALPHDSMSWDMISLGLEEPLPTQNVINDLNDIYFTIVHPSIPILHRFRFHAAMNLAPQSRPPVALRYAMWTHAAGMTEKYSNFQEYFYRRSRKYLELDEMRGHGEGILSLAHCQAWILMCVYEFKNMYFPRAWLSAGRAIRLAQMMGIHRLDGTGLVVKQCCPAPKDWTEKEERRRTFWMTFWVDRCASMGTGWPMIIDEKDIMTNLPSSENAFQNSQQENTMALREAMQGKSHGLSPFAGAVLLCAVFGRNLIHLHRPEPDDAEDDLNGKFWERHRSIDGILLRVGLGLPDQLRIPHGLPDPNVVFLNMCLHTSVICLHQSAIFKADAHKLPPSVGNESKIRCITAATEIAGIMRSVSHMDISVMNPFLAFNLYVAARVFVQYLKSRKQDSQIRASLGFLLAAMNALKSKNTLTESFLAQLEVDMEAAGMPKMNEQSSFESLIAKGVPENLRPRADTNCSHASPTPTAAKEGQQRNPSSTETGDYYGPFHPMESQQGTTHRAAHDVDVDMDPGGNGATFSLPLHHQSPSSFNHYSQEPKQPSDGSYQEYYLGFQNSNNMNSNPNAVEVMDMSPAQSGDMGASNSNGTGSSGQSHRSGSINAFTPPHSESSDANSSNQTHMQQQGHHMQQNWPANANDASIWNTPMNANGSTPASNASFSPPTNIMDQQQNQQHTPNLDNLTPEDFRKMAEQLFPGTPGMSGMMMGGGSWPAGMNGNNGPMRTGFTPAPLVDDFDPEAFSQFLESWNNGPSGGGPSRPTQNGPS